MNSNNSIKKILILLILFIMSVSLTACNLLDQLTGNPNSDSSEADDGTKPGDDDINPDEDGKNPDSDQGGNNDSPATVTVGEVSGTFVYNGNAHKPTLTVLADETALVSGTDYTLAYTNNTNAGTASVTVNFIGKYADRASITKSFTIQAAKADASIAAIGDYVYTGAPITPEISVTDKNLPLTENDYSVSFSNNVSAGAATVSVSFHGNFSGSSTALFNILPKDATSATLTVGDITLGSTPVVNVSLDGYTVTASDFDVTFGDYSKISTSVSASITFKGNFAGTLQTTFAVLTPNGEMPAVTLSKNVFTYNGSAHEPTVSVTAGEKTLILGTDYDVEYYNNVFATDNAIVKVTLKGEYSGVISETFAIAMLAVDIPKDPQVNLVYNGDVQRYPIPESEYYVISGDLASEAGNYYATVSLKDASNTLWNIGTDEPRYIQYTISALELTDVTVTAGDVVAGITPTVNVSSGQFHFIKDTDYTVDYGSYNKEGTATATVTFKGNFSGMFHASYTVSSAFSSVESYLDFNYNIEDKTGNHTTEMFGTDPTENYGRGDNSAVLRLTAGRKTGVKINDVSFGTDDFTFFVSAMFYPNHIGNGTNQGNAIIESGAHSQYNCDGTNKNSCPICNGSSLGANEFDCISVSLVKNEVSGQYPFRLRVQIGKENLAYKLTETEALSITNDLEFLNLAIVVDRRYSVSETTDTTRVTLYWNGRAIATKDFSLGIDQTLGSDTIYLGGNLEWTSGGGVKHRDKYIDTFILYNSALSEEQVKSIPNFVREKDKENDWYVDDMSISDEDIRSEYGAIYAKKLIPLKGAGIENVKSLSLAESYSGVTLVYDSAAGGYCLKLTGNAIDAAKKGFTVRVKSGDSIRSFTILFTQTTAVFIDDVYLTSLDFLDNKTKKIYFAVVDQNGNVPKNVSIDCTALTREGVSFGYSSSENKYFIQATYDQLTSSFSRISGNEAGAVAYWDLNTEVKTTEFSIHFHTPDLMDSAVERTVNNSISQTYISYADIKLGTDSWTIGVSMDVPNLNVGETIDIFSTSGRDASRGFTFSIKAETANMWSARVRVNGTTYWYKNISLHQYANQTVAIAVEIDRTEDGKIFTRVYYDRAENVCSSASKYKETYDTLDYDTTQTSGHTPVSILTFGGINTTLTEEDGGTLWTPSKLKNREFTIHKIVVIDTLAANSVTNYLYS